MAGVIWSDPFRGASNLIGRSNMRTTEASKFSPRVKRICGSFGSVEPLGNELLSRQVALQLSECIGRNRLALGRADML